ncbi:hypothetical protein [Nostoc sphaeroides]|uniref:Uncharacterized protein n=1 Tax=Nostoc sphaeroides CCNUC1 TaxID=2653204 RepID=A0A5P8WG89_9NOSO|nr:hypothetical protein [Nostoc sphaeroides]QFS51532.1 hypothetical protein GXM_09026 [Nostoc sphaeroides CCNUC1]
MIVISLGEGGEYLQMLTPQLLTNINDAQAPVLFKALLNLSLQTNMVRWSYDPMGREICATVELPLLDTILTEKQFGFCLEALVRIVDEIAMPIGLTHCTNLLSCALTKIRRFRLCSIIL